MCTLYIVNVSILRFYYLLPGMIDETLKNIRPFPPADSDAGTPEGMYILQEMPHGVIFPDEFEPGSSKHIESLVERMDRMYKETCPEIVNEWREFLAETPGTDDVFKVIEDKPLVVPLFDVVFSGTPVSANMP